MARLPSLKSLTSRATSAEPDVDSSPFSAPDTFGGATPSDGLSDGGSSVPMLPSVQAAMTRFAQPPMTSSQAGSVRFNVADPRGYHFPQVEEYVRSVEAAMAWWESADYAYKQALRDQQIEIDNLSADTSRLRTEIEVFKVQGSPLVNADGSYRTDSQEAAARADAERIAALEAELEAATRRLAELDTELTRARAYLSNPEDVDALREQLAAALARTNQLEEWAAQVQPIVTATEERAVAAEERAAAAEAELAQAQQRIAEQEAVEADLRAQIADLTGGQGSPVPAAEAEHVADPVADTDHASGWDDAVTGGWDEPTPSPVMPVDSELPPGVALPHREAPEAYAPVHPGDPLHSAAGVPLADWAPEVYGTDGEDDAAR